MSIKDQSGSRITIDADAFNSYVASGWQAIPLQSRGKRPLDSAWTTKQYDSDAVIARCVKEDRNMGVRLTAQQVIVDVDPRSGGREGFAKLCRDLDLDPSQWPRVETGSGGSHFYLLLLEGVRVVDTLVDYPGVEFKSAGRQCVAAGSIHPNGKPYAWDWLDHPPLADAPQSPAELIAAIKRPERTGEATGGGEYSQAQIASALDKLDVLEFGTHAPWLQLMMACHSASGGDARSEFVVWSCGDPKFATHGEAIGRRWDSLHASKPDGITFRTLNKVLFNHGAANAQAVPDASGDFPPVEDDGWLEGNYKQIANGLTYHIAEEIEAEEIEWLWRYRFAVGKLGMIAGFPDQGKSQITMNIAAIVSRGGNWPNGEGKAKQGAAVILSAEDDKADTIRPRLEAAGADLNQCIILNSIVRTEESARVFNFADDLGKLATIINEERERGRSVRLVIIDPISAYMGGKSKGDSFKNSEMRALLTPLAEWASLHRIAVIAVSHFNKGGSGRALYRVTDSLAFTAAARTVWLTAEEEGETGRKLFLKGKSNIAADPGGLAYMIEGVTIPGGISAPRIVWDGAVTVTADEALAQRERKPSAVDSAKDFLSDLLSEGPQQASEIFKAAKAHGHSDASIRRAKSKLGAISGKEGFNDGEWRWSLPADEFEETFEGGSTF